MDGSLASIVGLYIFRDYQCDDDVKGAGSDRKGRRRSQIRGSERLAGSLATVFGMTIRSLRKYIVDYAKRRFPGEVGVEVVLPL